MHTEPSGVLISVLRGPGGSGQVEGAGRLSSEGRRRRLGSVVVRGGREREYAGLGPTGVAAFWRSTFSWDTGTQKVRRTG